MNVWYVFTLLFIIRLYQLFPCPTANKYYNTFAVNIMDCMLSQHNNACLYFHSGCRICTHNHVNRWSTQKERMQGCQWRNDRWKRGSALWLRSHQGCGCEMAIDWFLLYLPLPWWTQHNHGGRSGLRVALARCFSIILWWRVQAHLIALLHQDARVLVQIYEAYC